MSDMFGLLFSTLIFRWYVFVFLLAFLVTALFKVGPKKTLLFLLSGWFIAFVSEFSSVRNGFPFGLYTYIPSTVDRELWIWGIPFMDSLSFTFLAYASWTMARFFLAPSTGAGLFFQINERYVARGKDEKRFSWDVILLSALFFMIVDVIIDPVALQGDKWFLGKIYYYPEPGPYFGVTIANFAGWFFVGLLVFVVWRMIDRQVHSLFVINGFPTLDLWGPLLYFGVVLFNINMSFAIGDFNLGWASTFIVLPIAALFFFRLAGRR